MMEKTRQRSFKESDFSIERVMQAGEKQGIDFGDMRKKAGGNWKRIEYPLQRAYVADVLTDEPKTLKELSTLMDAALSRPGDFNVWLRDMEQMSAEGSPLEFASRVHDLYEQVLEEKVRATLGVLKEIPGRPAAKKK